MKAHFLQNAVLLLSLFSLATSSPDHPPSNSSSRNEELPSEALALLAFKSKADLHDKLPFSPNTSSSYCKWQGVECQHGKVVRFVLQGLNLAGVFAPNTLTRLDQLRILSLQNNSLTGAIPDLSGLDNLKAVFLDHNSFTDSIPPSVTSLHRLKTLDLSYNDLTGSLPVSLTNLDRLYYLRLDSNRFNGSIPPLNQSSLRVFNVSRNNLTGAVPATPTLRRFGTTSYSWNPGLCGEVIRQQCNPTLPFFGPSITPPPPLPPPTISASQQLQGVELTRARTSQVKHRRTALIIGFSAGFFVLIGSVLCFMMTMKKQRKRLAPAAASDYAAAAEAADLMRIEQNELEEKVRRVQGMQMAGKSGNLVFCAGESQLYTLDQLMRASAELLGRGTIGSTYKAVNHILALYLLVFGVALKFSEPYASNPYKSGLGKCAGTKSARAKPLHWTSCLKIAEDVAQGLSYIHQAWRLVHGNLKSSNVLLGSDFEACLTDYCLSVFANPSNDDDPNSAAYKAPEIRKLNHQATSKSDVYSFGIILLELLTGKPPSQHPYLVPDDLINWVRSARDEDGGEDNRLVMLLEVAIGCSATSPEQRPTMWQVLKMIQEIKEVVMQDGEMDAITGAP
ncbi:hypothetical protein RJ639_016827 [Escallonia herrerae]|uniref:Protein kinase domain-containing protein n=1 Tax=Escallonia herrerae TaxID=1293975 RepID=A0AA88VGA6_9ASTE|nr:hypothetical protein RJ639_016827 [Escallonia herrerae]